MVFLSTLRAAINKLTKLTTPSSLCFCDFYVNGCYQIDRFCSSRKDMFAVLVMIPPSRHPAKVTLIVFSVCSDAGPRPSPINSFVDIGSRRIQDAPDFLLDLRPEDSILVPFAPIGNL